MLTAQWNTLVAPLRRMPGIGWVVLLGLVLAIGGLVAIDVGRGRGLEARAARADSSARVAHMEAVILHRDARAALAKADSADRRADRETHRADSLSAIAAARRTDVVALLGRAAASRSLVVDYSTLPDEAIEALADGDSLRIAVPLALAADSAALAAKDTAIAGYRATITTLRTTIVLDSAAFERQAAALAAREEELEAVRRQHAPRCGAKCGALLGGLLLEVVHQVPAIVRALARGS